jgi:hypothetical protein
VLQSCGCDHSLACFGRRPPIYKLEQLEAIAGAASLAEETTVSLPIVEAESVFAAAHGTWAGLISQRVSWHAEVRQDRGPIDARMYLGECHGGCAHAVATLPRAHLIIR